MNENRDKMKLLKNLLERINDKRDYIYGDIIYTYHENNRMTLTLVLIGVKKLNIREQGQEVKYKYLILHFINNGQVYKRKVLINRLSPWMSEILSYGIFTNDERVVLESKDLEETGPCEKREILENVKIRKDLIYRILRESHNVIYHKYDR